MQYIYLLRTYGKDKTLVKLGYSSNVYSRLSQYISDNPLIEVIQFYIGENAYEFEQDFHSKHPAVSGNEWYEESLLDTMVKEIESNGFTKVGLVKESIKQDNFQDTIIKLESNQIELTQDLIDKYPFLEEAINSISLKGIKKLNYSITNTKRQLIQLSVIKNRKLLIDHFKENQTFNLNKFYSASEIKQTLSNIYKEYNITTAPKASDINLFYQTKTHTPRIDSKPTAGFILLSLNQ